MSGFKALCRRISKFSEFGIISYHLSLELILKLVIHFITFTHFKQRKSRMENVNHHNPDEILTYGIFASRLLQKEINKRPIGSTEEVHLCSTVSSNPCSHLEKLL